MFKELVKRARSTRRFDQSQPISEEELRQIIDIVRIVPSGANIQPLRYRIVSRKEEREAVFPFTAWAGALKEWPGPGPEEQPTGYIVILSKQDAAVDIGISGMTIQLTATHMGYSTCMLGAINRPEIKKALSIPDPYEVKLMIAIGKSAETVVIDDVHEGESLTYYRDEKDVHHVPKLSLDDVIIT